MMNMMRNKMYSLQGKAITLSAVALFCCGTAMAQMGGGQSSTQSPSTGAAGSANAASNSPGAMNNMDTSADSSGASMNDKMFAKKALAGGMTEVEAGKLAVAQGSSQDVKQFGQKMIDDHTKLGDQLKPIAAKIGVNPPSDLPSKEKKMLASLQGLSGDAFDQAYIKAMLKDHKDDNNDFKMEANMGQYPQLKDAAAQGDRVIQQHLQMIQQIAKAHNITTDKKSGF